MDLGIRFLQRAEPGARPGHGVRQLPLVPHGPATRWASHGVEAQLGNAIDIVAPERRLVSPEREAGRVPAVEPEPGLTPVLGPIQQCQIDRHVGPPGTGRLIDPELPIRSHTPRLEGSCRPDFGRRTRCRSGPQLAIPCVPGPRGTDRPLALGNRADPIGPQSPAPGYAAHCSAGCSPGRPGPPRPPGSPPESKSARRRTDRALPWTRSPL